MSVTQSHVEDLFERALELGTEHERSVFLDEQCAGDVAVRERVEALLLAHDAAGGFLDQPAMGEQPTIDTPISEGPGTVIGRYKLLQQIGEGGFGVVYMAQQERPVQRRVALKIIKLGMDTKQVIGRFEAERQALALMDHPNIAKVLDAGATDTGRPYFVMELVKGVPITEYCDQNNLAVSERLKLFKQVCHAVQHAHHKGIIHRDLKPSNVMITLHDGVPVPMVIDFGIAKATNQKLTEKTVFTEFKQFIGTPEYMSPEQAEMSGLDIDTRSDIYSLGVLLYELLTGTTPFDAKRLRSAAYGEIQRIIRTEQPHKPSARLTTLESLNSIAAHRQSEPKKLGVLIKGDLDWIVMRAMEKDRTRRYETANGLANDVQRFLDDEPVLAGPPSTSYRMRKFLHRNRVAVTIAALVVFFLTGGLTIAIIGLSQANHSNTLMVKAQDDLEDERDRAQLLQSLARKDIALAVMPFNNAMDDPEQDYFVEGVARLLINEIRSINAVDVRSFDATMKYFDNRAPDQDIARDLQVQLMLRGSVLVGDDDESVRIDLRLGEPDRQPIWSETFETTRADLPQFERQATEALLAAIHQWDDRNFERVVQGDTSSQEAREMYMKGVSNMRASDREDLRRAVSFFDRATELDPNYGLAYVAKAQALHLQSTLGVRPEDFNPQARAAARKAIAVDDTFAEAWAVLGTVQLNYEWDWKAAFASFTRALELDPFSCDAHLGIAGYYSTIGEFDRCVQHLKRAIEIDATVLLTNEAAHYLAFTAQDLETSIEICRHAIDMNRKWWSPHSWLALSLAWSGRTTEAVVEAEEAYELEPQSPIALALLSSCYALDGRIDDAHRVLDDLLDFADANYVCPYEIATVFMTLGDRDSAYEYIDKAVNARSECVPFMPVDVRMLDLHDDEEFQQILSSREVNHPLAGKDLPWLEPRRERLREMRRNAQDGDQ